MNKQFVRWMHRSREINKVVLYQRDLYLLYLAWQAGRGHQRKLDDKNPRKPFFGDLT